MGGIFDGRRSGAKAALTHMLKAANDLDDVVIIATLKDADRPARFTFAWSELTPSDLLVAAKALEREALRLIFEDEEESGPWPS